MTSILIPTLVLGLWAVPPEPPPPLAAVAPSAVEDAAALLAEYEQAYEAWRAKLAEATGTELSKLYERPPQAEFWPRFRALAQDGDKAAVLWTLQHANSARLGNEEYRRAVLEGYRILFFDHQDDPETLATAGSNLEVHTYVVPVADLTEVMREAHAAATSDEVKAMTGFHAGQLLVLGGEEDARAEAREWLAGVKAGFPASEYAAEADDVLFVLDNLVVGVVAPEFGGMSIDGDEIKLADHRGKIVVLDFFGFW